MMFAMRSNALVFLDDGDCRLEGKHGGRRTIVMVKRQEEFEGIGDCWRGTYPSPVRYSPRAIPAPSSRGLRLTPPPSSPGLQFELMHICRL